MKRVLTIPALAAAAAALSLPTIASACGTPSEQWYRNASDIIFDATAKCKPEEETCRFKVNRIIKNPLHLEVERRPFDVDYYSWFEEYMKNNPNSIVLACGVPNFKPEEERISGRFYANLDREKQELVIRRYVTKEDRRD